MPILEWADENFSPPSRTRDLEAQTVALVAELQKQPGRWALVASFPEDPPKARRRREALLKYAPAELEVNVVSPDVWARIVGPEEVAA